MPRRFGLGHTQRSGFTLLELMIVVALVSVIAAIAMPSILRARKSANEAAAISYLKAIASAQEQYNLRTGEYAPGDEELVAAGYIAGQSTVPGENQISGYTFIVDAPLEWSWFANASPVVPGQTGDRYFYIDVTGVLRWSDLGEASAASPPLDGSQPPP